MWVVWPDNVGGLAGQCGWSGQTMWVVWLDEGGDSWTEMGMNPDITPPSKVQRPDAPTVKGEVLVGECGGTR